MADSEQSGTESDPVIYDKTHRGIRFTFRVKVVSGEEGERLALEQARAIRELLLWVRSQRTGRVDDSTNGAHRTQPGASSNQRDV